MNPLLIPLMKIPAPAGYRIDRDTAGIRWYLGECEVKDSFSTFGNRFGLGFRREITGEGHIHGIVSDILVGEGVRCNEPGARYR